MAKYAIALVTDDTPDYLEYGDYRGLVILDDETGETQSDADGWVHPDSLEEARDWIAAKEHVDRDRVQITEHYPHDVYQQAWDVAIAPDLLGSPAG